LKSSGKALTGIRAEAARLALIFARAPA